MSLRFLSLLNVSNPDRMTADSGYIFSGLLATALLDKGHEYVSLSPVPLPDIRAGHRYMSSPSTKYRARYDFPYEDVLAHLRDEAPDVVLVNQVELAPKVRAIVQELRLDAKVVVYCHYLPFFLEGEKLLVDPSLDDHGLGMPIAISFVAGLAAADQVFVHSETARSYVVKLCSLFGYEPTRQISLLPPPLDPELLLPKIAEEKRSRIIYNHRLYEHYGTHRFVELARALDESVDAEIVVLDPAALSSSARRKLDPSPMQFADELGQIPSVTVLKGVDTREKYGALLRSCDLAIAPFRENCTWSMSCIDCESISIPVVAPRMAWFDEHIHDELLFDTVAEAVELVHELLTNAQSYERATAHCSTVLERLTPARVAEEFLTVLGEQNLKQRTQLLPLDVRLLKAPATV